MQTRQAEKRDHLKKMIKAAQAHRRKSGVDVMGGLRHMNSEGALEQIVSYQTGTGENRIVNVKLGRLKSIIDDDFSYKDDLFIMDEVGRQFGINLVRAYRQFHYHANRRILEFHKVSVRARARII